MNKLFSSALVAAIIAGGSLAGSAASAADVTLRCQHFISPKGAVPSRFMEPWIEKVEAESGGKLKVELYPGMQLGGKPPALYDQIRDGVIDCGWALPAYTPGRFPSTEALEQPFVTTNNAEESSMAAWDYIQKHGLDDLKDVHLIAVHVHGPGVIHKKGPPVKTLEDMNGLKLRGPSRAANGLLESMGATPVGMPVPAFPEALSKGVVDGGVIPEEITVPLKVHELADSHTYIGGDRSLYNTFFIWAMNKNSYESLPDDIKAVIDANSGLEASAWAGRAMKEGDEAMSPVIKGTGNEIYTLTDEERARWEDQAAPLVEAWAANTENGAERLADAKALMEKYAGTRN
ncbi:MAG: TRAP transporter substrate-binding protein [Pseudomonadota bacterium]